MRVLIPFVLWLLLLAPLPLAAQNSEGPPAGYIGSQSCASCHPAQAKAWGLSQHARAMESASDASVRGDFSGVEVQHFSSRAKFFRRGGKFWVETEGKDGKRSEFEITHTFGLEPLQQYLVSFPDGRKQALSYAWDTRPKEQGGQRWFHLYPDEDIAPSDPLHWTGLQQNWNYMCADCHATGLRKNYNAVKDAYATSWSELGVGCEACHGPAGGHLAWAKGDKPSSVPHKGFSSVAARRAPHDWTPDPATGSPTHGVARPSGDEVETCAVCHARRGQFSEAHRPGLPLADHYRASLLTPDLFEYDGQMKDEVFNYASFLQSRMYAKGVGCTDCHDPHSGKLPAKAADACSACHAPQKFTAVSHTGHQPGPKAPDCIACHMPAKTYMGVDVRHDHSFRIPRPDLSIKFGTPNTCAACHPDKTAAWAAAAIETWHGPERKGFQTYTAAFHAARALQPEARDLLLAVAKEPGTPAIARATALNLLSSRPSRAVAQEIERSLSDPDPLVRAAAAQGLAIFPPSERWRLGAALLSDPVALVRLETFAALADQPTASLGAGDRQRFDRAQDEYVTAQKAEADRPEGRANLGILYARQGHAAEAEAEYLAGLKLAPTMTRLHVNLADLYRATGRDAEAETVLRQAVAIAPQEAAPHHALGLALVRRKQMADALDELAKAAELAPANSRFAYVYAVALNSAGKSEDARKILVEAFARDPSSVEIASLLMQDSLRRGDVVAGLDLARRLKQLTPDEPRLLELINQLERAQEKR